jgi:perosamine synthetase
MQTLDNNRLSYGPMTEAFEHRFAQIHECRFGVFSNSGTSSLHISVAALKEMGGWRDGDEIIVPSVTFVSTPNVVLHNNLTPVFVDVDRAYYELAPALIEARITPRTRAIIPVHVFGQPCDMDAIGDIARRHNLKIIEDSCETMFSRYKGRRVGSLGDIACFSTYVAHLLATGIGGLSTTNDPDCAIMLRSLMNHGRDSIYLSIDDDDDKTPDELRMIVERRFRFAHMGHSFRATEMEAAIGLAQLETWESMIASRRRCARILTQGLAPFGDRMQLPAIRPEAEHAFMMYPIVLKDEPKVDLVNYLERHGVETRDMLPLIEQPLYVRKQLLRPADYPVAQWIDANGFYIGCHQELGDSDLDYIVELFERYWKGTTARVATGAALVLVLEGDDRYAADALDQIPLELFRQTIVLRRGPATGCALPPRGAQVEEYGIGTEDPLHYVRNELNGTSCDQVVFFTADGRRNPADVSKLLVLLGRGHDIVIASRFLLGAAHLDQAEPVSYRSVGNRFFTAMANLMFYGKLTDAVNPFFAIRRERLIEAPLTERGLRGMYQLSITAMKQRWQAAELPTIEQRRPSRADLLQAWGSVVPLSALLWKEWRAAKQSRGRSRRPS